MASGIIGKVTAGGGTHLVTSTFYGTCATAANTVAKIVKLADATPDSATLITGMTLAVKFTYSNTAANPTLTVQRNANTTNLITAKSIKRYGTTAPGTTVQTSWRAGAVVLFIYDGTNWVMVSSLDDDTTYTSKTAASGGTDVSLVTTGEKYTWNNKSDLTIGTSATTAAAGNHTHTTSLVSDTGTSSITLASAGKYKLTAGDSSVIFTMPTSNDYTHPTTAGNKHIPAGGSSGDFLVYAGSSGTATWTSFPTFDVTVPTGSTTRTTDVTLNTTSVLSSLKSAGSTPTLGTAFTIPNITNVGTTPTLGTAFTIPNITSKNVVVSASVVNEVLTVTTGASVTTGTAFTVPNITSVGTTPTLGTAFTVPNVTAVGSMPTFNTTNVATSIKTQPTFTVDTETSYMSASWN